MDAQCVGIFPAESPARSGRAVNIMAAFANTGEARNAFIRCFGSNGGPWRELLRKKCELPEDGHVHLYFTLSADCFAPEKWGGQSCEELSVWFGERAPGKDDTGVLLYFE